MSEPELAALVAAYYRKECNRLIDQAEHWHERGLPLAVHHRVTKADNYFQIVALMERPSAFEEMRRCLEIPNKGAGLYPPRAEIHAYRDPRFVVTLLRTPEKGARS